MANTRQNCPKIPLRSTICLLNVYIFMKKLLFSLVLLMGAFTFVNAQVSEVADAPKKKSCSKVCTAKSTSMAAAKLAAMDESIEAKTCSKTGAVSYYRNSTCPVSGTTTAQEVKYCTTSKAFVNVAPSEVETPVKKVSMEAAPAKKKACSKSCKKACSKSKKAATTSVEAAPKVKLVSTTSENQ